VSGPVAEGPASHPVTDQVFGQVTRLVSRGDGTHRLTLRLHPADLGEVKVVLTVKDGAVDVSLSAGPAAREALREGSPQLRALLELTGATTANVVVRDAAGSAAATVVGGQQATGQQPSGAGTGDAHDQGADPDLASRDGLADGSTDSSPNGNGDADTGAAAARDLSGPGALAGVRVRLGEATAPPGATEPAPPGIPARLDLNL
jgi:flagellar hook-length control protein FliK